MILIEGLPGSGKTTAAKQIHQVLVKANISSQVFLEGNIDHPADYDGVAFFTPEQFVELKRRHREDCEILEKRTNSVEKGYMIQYKKLLQENNNIFSKDLLNEILCQDIYELPLAQHMDLILKKWESFVSSCQNKPNQVILECVFIQNPVTVTLIRENAPHSLIKSYIRQIADIIRPLNPLLIYLKASDLKASFERIVQERPKSWYEGFEHYYANRGFGLYKGLSGINGILEVLNERLKLELDIFASLDMKKVLVEKSDDDQKRWSTITPSLFERLAAPTET
ncbi:MAG TPA: hypothetical protein P5107_08795 [Thermotogota bacterium]|nr:hypothetical protein [Thermotogota bacterium]HRW35139.1 hypothetical protein [Thermotogota bacterium]